MMFGFIFIWFSITNYKSDPFLIVFHWYCMTYIFIKNKKEPQNLICGSLTLKFMIMPNYIFIHILVVVATGDFNIML